MVVKVRASNGPAEGSIQLDSCNLSEGGAFLRSDLLFEIGETLSLEIPLPSGVITAGARVVRVWRQADPATVPGMGIEFTGLTAQDRSAIASSIGSASAPAAP